MSSQASAAAAKLTIPSSFAPVLSYVTKFLKLKSSIQSSSSSSKLLRPLVIGISGAQGLGKSTLAEVLQRELESPRGGSLKVKQFSLDDVYLTHAEQTSLAKSNPTNPLVQNRGQPGTHDVPLCLKVLEALCGPRGQDVEVPVYDKSKFGGEGDRVFGGKFPEQQSDQEGPEENSSKYLDIVIFEGWCVGFQHLPETTALESYIPDPVEDAAATPSSMETHIFKILKSHSEYLHFVNNNLKQYQKIWDFFDVFVHLDSRDINWVYDWRLQQEHALIKQKGTGKTDLQVKQFIDGYMSSYYIYLPQMRSYMDEQAATKDAFLKKKLGENTKGHIRLIVDHERVVETVYSNEIEGYKISN